MGAVRISGGDTGSRTAASSTLSLGWNELGPSSHRYFPSEHDVMLPPTRSRASVTRTDWTLSLCFVSNARAVTRPEIPAPTITAS